VGERAAHQTDGDATGIGELPTLTDPDVVGLGTGTGELPTFTEPLLALGTGKGEPPMFTWVEGEGEGAGLGDADGEAAGDVDADADVDAAGLGEAAFRCVCGMEVTPAPPAHAARDAATKTAAPSPMPGRNDRP